MGIERAGGLEDLRPGQALGPRLNGINPIVSALRFSHLSGRNSSASFPKLSLLRWVAQEEKMTRAPFLIKTLEFPSGPPPVGSHVSLLAVRALKGTGG